jgi:hypothetical protein
VVHAKAVKTFFRRDAGAQRKTLIRGIPIQLLSMITGLIEGLIAGLVFNWIVFNLLLGLRESQSGWLLMLKVLIVLGFTCAGFVLVTWETGSSKESWNGYRNRRFC